MEGRALFDNFIIPPADDRCIRAIWGLEHGVEIPTGVVHEYRQRLRMYHRSGASGPLGPIGLVDMARHLGFAVKIKPESPESVDWRKMPTDGSVRIKAYYYGDWQEGVYLGAVDMGTLAIRLDSDDDRVRECRKSNVILIGTAEPAQLPVESPDKRMDLLAAVAEEKAMRAAEPVKSSPPSFLAERPLQFLGQLEPGGAVWVTLDDDVVEGQLKSVENETAAVLIDGVIHSVPLADLIPVG